MEMPGFLKKAFVAGAMMTGATGCHISMQPVRTVYVEPAPTVYGYNYPQPYYRPHPVYVAPPVYRPHYYGGGGGFRAPHRGRHFGR